MQAENKRIELETAQLMYMRLSGETSTAEHEAWLEEHRQWMVAAAARKRPLIEILDLSQAAALNAQQRKLQGDWNQRTAQLMRDAVLGIAFIAPSAIMRGVITAVFWIKPPPIPHAVTGSLDEALNWSFELYEAQGGRVPTATRQAARASFATAAPAAAAGSGRR